MLQSRFPRRQTISTVILTCGVVLGLVLCYFVAIPFVPAIVGSFTLSVIFVPLDKRIRKTVGSVGVSAAATVTVVAIVVVIRPSSSLERCSTKPTEAQHSSGP